MSASTTLRNLAVRTWLHWHGIECQGKKPWLMGRFPKVHIDPSARIVLGSSCTLGDQARLSASGRGEIVIGDESFINTYGGGIHATSRITFGDHCLVADHVVLIDDSFHDVSPDRPRRSAPITIGRNVWLSANVRVLPGITIGNHSVIGAGSVVTRDIPARCFAAGAPARPIRYFECPDDWCRR